MHSPLFGDHAKYPLTSDRIWPPATGPIASDEPINTVSAALSKSLDVFIIVDTSLIECFDSFRTLNDAVNATFWGYDDDDTMIWKRAGQSLAVAINYDTNEVYGQETPESDLYLIIRSHADTSFSTFEAAASEALKHWNTEYTIFRLVN